MPESASSGAAPAHSSVVRTDIQALRAFAVLAVVLFHLWPIALPGGYIGVDVFFVISGFLITGQLIRSRERGTLRLRTFWTARARRLLPASLVVLLVSVALTVLWAPETLQGQYFRSIIGSALYVENWLLAADGIDYLAHDNQPPIAQHYWSLSVEEQFYILWPLLVIIAMAGARRLNGAGRRTMIVFAAIIAVAGFAASIMLTATIYPYGYFSTVSRLWEFAIGALVALLPALRLSSGWRLVVVSASILVLLATLFAFGTGTPFPGPAAIIPVLATAAIIAAGPDARRNGLDRLMAIRPVQWIGDQSYGIYLWHWPLVVIAPSVLGRPADLPENVLILLLTVALAAATKRWVEDPIRFGTRSRQTRPGRIALVTAASMAVVVAAAALPMWQNSLAAAERQEAAATALADPSACLGAHDLLDPDCSDGASDAPISADELVPTLAGLYEDTGGAYGCYDYDPAAADEPTSCTIGDGAGGPRIALNGDSHGAMLVPGLRDVIDEHGWTIDTFVGRGCTWKMPADAGCEQRNADLDARFLSGDYDAILVTGVNSASFDAADRRDVAERYAAAWRAAEDAGVQVIVLADNPAVPQSAQDCVATTTEFSESTCSFPRSASLMDADPLRMAAEDSGATLIDLSDAYCTEDLCPMQLGGVLVYRDLHHITATFSRSLAPYLADGIADALAR